MPEIKTNQFNDMQLFCVLKSAILCLEEHGRGTIHLILSYLSKPFLESFSLFYELSYILYQRHYVNVFYAGAVLGLYWVGFPGEVKIISYKTSDVEVTSAPIGLPISFQDPN